MSYTAPIKKMKRISLKGKSSGDRTSLKGRNRDLQKFRKLYVWKCIREAYSDTYDDDEAKEAVKNRGQLAPAREKAAPMFVIELPWGVTEFKLKDPVEYVDNRARHFYGRVRKPNEHPTNQSLHGLQVWKYINAFERDFLHNKKPISIGQALAWIRDPRNVLAQ